MPPPASKQQYSKVGMLVFWSPLAGAPRCCAGDYEDVSSLFPSLLPLHMVTDFVGGMCEVGAGTALGRCSVLWASQWQWGASYSAWKPNILDVHKL